MNKGCKNVPELPTFRRVHLVAALGALLTALGFRSLAADPPKCNFYQLAEWPVQFERGLPVVQGSINGKKIGVLLDTGAYSSMITKAAAKRLNLSTRSTPVFVTGIGGKSRVLLTPIDELRIAGVVVPGLRVPVAGEQPIAGVDFFLGNDVFRGFDIEFDYANGVVRLFQPQICKDVSLAYWDANALQLPMEDEDNIIGDKHEIIVPIKVNGRGARALIDSGSSSSLVDLSLASKVGVTPETAGVVPSGCSSGVGANLVRSWVARFDTVAIAEETIRNSLLYVSDYLPDDPFSPGVILGTDFLRAHRMLVSRSQRKVYFSYSGGQVFPSTPALDCDERVRDRSTTEALATYDEAIAKNPSDTKALLQRAALRARQDDAKGAVSDLDAVIRIEPANAVARSLRSGVRAALEDYEGALADADAAIANGMRTAQMYFTRARLRQALGDHTRAIEEYDAALKLDPRDRWALRGRGRSSYYAGRFEAAESDFATLLSTQPSGWDSIWLSLSRNRRGLDGSAVLEQGVAKLKDGEWPAPILQYLLGRLDREALMVATAGTNETKRKGKQCEARFYVAVRLITDGQTVAARPLLENARNECPRNYVEYEAALVELAKIQ